MTLKGHTHAIKSVSFSPDGQRIASGSRDNTVKVWDAANRLLFRGYGNSELTLRCSILSSSKYGRAKLLLSRELLEKSGSAGASPSKPRLHVAELGTTDS
jgi:WD40 repeat protein